jgi:Immunity protein 50
MDSTSLKSIYGNTIPTLNGATLHDIVLSREGPKVCMRLDLVDYPEEAPKKWNAAAFNRVQVSLIALGIRTLTIEGLSSNMRVDLNVGNVGGFIRLNAKSEAFRIDLCAEFLVVEKISAYREELRR